MTAALREVIQKARARENLTDRLIIAPLLDAEGQIGPGTVDLRLGSEFLEVDRQNQTRIQPADNSPRPLARHTRRYVPLGEEYVLHPGQFVLGATLEFLSIPADFFGQVLSRSSWGRLGLLVATAVVVQPGYRGVLTLELVNTGSVPIELRAGLRIAQLQLWQAHSATEHPYSANGQYDVPLGPESPRFARDRSELDKMTGIAKRMRGETI